METKAKQYFKTAQLKLNDAKQELYRPEKDLVAFSVCKNAQHAIEHYLKGYLLNNDVQIKDNSTIDQLYNQCLRINKNFKKVDLSDLKCKGDELKARYCTEGSKVMSCFDAAENLDAFLRNERII